MKKNLKSIIQKLEKIEENQTGQLQGGFASIGSSDTFSSELGPTNKHICNWTNKNCSKACTL